MHYYHPFLTWCSSWRCLPPVPALLSSCSPPCLAPYPRPYQRSTAEQDHEDDEGLEPAVLHNAVAGLSQSPPDLPWGLRRVYHAARTASDAACGEGQQAREYFGLMAEGCLFEGMTGRLG